MNIKTKLSIPFFIVLACCILVALGSLRNIIGPMGYWLAWAVVGGVGLLCAFDETMSVVSDVKFKFVSGGFFLLFLGMLLAGAVNEDRYTFFQSLKFLAIYAMFFVLCCCSRRLSVAQLLLISKITILSGCCLFLICKFFLKDFYVVLGDGRAGSQFAFPGVLWKTPAFFMGFILAGSVIARRIGKVDSLVLLSAIYLLFSDASRTGFIWVIIMCFILFAREHYHRAFKVASARMLVLSAVIIICVACLGPTVLSRLFQGDVTRAQMLMDGVANAKECFVIGCGFGSTFSVVLGESMVIHNAYLGALADLGLLGLVGLLILVMVPVYGFFYGSARKIDRHDNETVAFVAMLGGAGYGLLMMLHPLSSELSEWGVWALMVAWQFSLCSSSTADQLEESVLE